MDIKSEQLAKWLDITEQQNQVLQTIYSLESANLETSPKNILEEYSRKYDKSIQSNNLFTIIRILEDYGLIVKKEKARYSVNVDGIKERIIKNNTENKKEISKVDEFIKNLDDYYKSIARDIRPQITFYNSRELFNKTADNLINATAYYVTTRFPNIVFSKPIAHKIWLDKYVNILQERCFVKKDLKIIYITQLMTDHIYKHALEIYGKPELAIREVEMALGNLWNNAMSNEKFEVYYLPNLMGLYMSVIEKNNEPTEAFLFMQSEENVDGIYIKSREIALQAKKSFLTGLEDATPLTGAKGRKIIESAKKKLHEKHKA